MMNEESVFDRNIARFAALQPKVAYLLPYHEPVGTDIEETLVDAEAWFNSLDLASTEVLCVLGVGRGHIFTAATSWLRKNPKRHLFFLEDDLSVIYRLFETGLGEELLHDPQVTLRYSKNLLEDQELSDWLCWDCLLQPMTVVGSPGYSNHRAAFVCELQNKLQFDHHRLDEAVDEYLDHGISYFRNFYANLLHLHESYLGDSLFSQFTGMPAIICGAGPSLSKDLPLLESLQNNAVVFAGGSALNALNSAGLQPHFGAGVDPNDAQYERYLQQSAFELPFFYRQRLNRHAFELLHGPRLYLTGGGGYDIASFFEESLDIESEDLDEGHNVVNLCTTIAQALGCNPIIYLGLDLAFTGMQSYAAGVIDDASVEEHAIVTNTGVDKAAVMRSDVHGKPIYTLWKWIAESEWLSKFAQEHPETTFINATDAGLGVQGIPNQPLSLVAQSHLTKSYPIDDKVWQAIQQANLPDDALERVQGAWNELEASLTSCIEKFDIMISELKNLWQKVSYHPEGITELRTGLMSVTEFELEEEVAFGYVLGVFNGIFVRVFNRDLRLLKASQDTLQNKQFKQLELETRRYAFLQQTANVNRHLMQEALKNHQKKRSAVESSAQIPQHKGDGEERRRYYSDGSLAVIERWKGSKRHGLQEHFYPDQTIKSLISYVNGLLDGEVSLYHRDGQLKRLLKYSKGQRTL
ncbi:MAG: DUF115 domain-containing protein [Chlamydiales bacterium]|nr:DUF115 domain-containing protein [Chlamydiales bacterium]